MADGLQIGYSKLYAIVCAPLFLALMVAVYFYMEIWSFVVVGITLIFSMLHLLLFKMVFDREEIGIQYFRIFRRRIKSQRLSSIQLVCIGSVPHLIICLDGHRPYWDSGDYKWFSSSPDVIQFPMTFSDEERESYVAGLQALYGEKVTIEPSYQKEFCK